MKKMLKTLILILAITICIITVSNYQVMALGDIISEGQAFVSNGKQQGSAIDLGKMKTTSDTIYGILFTIAIVVAVAVATYLGVQLMLASVEDKAQYKEALVPFVVGCIIVFGSFGIWKVAMGIAHELDTARIQTTIVIATEQ